MSRRLRRIINQQVSFIVPEGIVRDEKEGFHCQLFKEEPSQIVRAINYSIEESRYDAYELGKGQRQYYLKIS